MTPEQIRTCRDAILSESAADFILPYTGNFEEMSVIYNTTCIQQINDQNVILHTPVDDFSTFQHYNFIYSMLPSCYGLSDYLAMNEIGVNKIRSSPYLNLYGNDVLLGFIDTGVDYQHPCFTYENKTSRILRIWDQTIQTGQLPDGFSYGSEYTNIDINLALNSADPLSIVPSIDSIGHGTCMAGIASGKSNLSESFSGVAPLSNLLIVKLKPAKKYLREYYFINKDAVCYQETDIIMGTKYLLQVAKQLGKPLVICLGIGTNSGSHDGTGLLNEYLYRASKQKGTCIVVSSGNEATNGLHYRGILPKNADYTEIELKVGEKERGFTLEFWANIPGIYSVGISSPNGQFIQNIPESINFRQKIAFPLDATTMYIDYHNFEARNGNQLIFMRFETPSSGIWKIRVNSVDNYGNFFDMWLPIKNFLSSDTHFLKPDPNITITNPGNTPNVITVGYYSQSDGSIAYQSSRGFTRNGLVKPDIVAPGINVIVPQPNDEYEKRSGSSIAAAITAGAVALILEWSIIKNNIYITNSTVKNLLIKGARRGNDHYPNQQYGYGILDVYQSLLSASLIL